MKIIRIAFISLLLILAGANRGIAQNIVDYLILQDIAPYKMSQPKTYRSMGPVGGPKVREGAGIVSGSGHFNDHADMTYELMYLGQGAYSSPTVTVTQHAGADSDKWLMHEMEEVFRETEQEKIGLMPRNVGLRMINNNKVLWIGLGTESYLWISNNVVVGISARTEGDKPRPIEVVQAYLVKFPSTIPSAYKLNSAHDIEWIKDEMDRRLWLCDKWVPRIQAGDPNIYPTLKEIVDHMNVFLSYREKYFGIRSAEEKMLLMDYYWKKDDTALKTKLAEYKTWWTAHKADSITLP